MEWSLWRGIGDSFHGMCHAQNEIWCAPGALKVVRRYFDLPPTRNLKAVWITFWAYPAKNRVPAMVVGCECGCSEKFLQVGRITQRLWTDAFGEVGDKLYAQVENEEMV